MSDQYDISNYKVIHKPFEMRCEMGTLFVRRGDVQHIPTGAWITFEYCDTEEEWKDWMSVTYELPKSSVGRTTEFLNGAKDALIASGISMARETLLNPEEWERYKRNYIDALHPENPNKFGYNVVKEEPMSWWRKLWKRLQNYLNKRY